MPEDTRTEEELFIDSLIDNEKHLALAIKAGKTVEEVRDTLGFDEAQYETMQARLASFNLEEGEATEDSEGDAVENTEAVSSGTSTQTEADAIADMAKEEDIVADGEESVSEEEKGDGAIAEGGTTETV